MSHIGLPTRARAAVRHLRHGAIGAKFLNRVRRSAGKPPRLLRRGGVGDRNDSSRRINAFLSERNGASRYLEVGVQYGRTLEDVLADDRWAVDPMPLFDWKRLPAGVRVFVTTSDEFFSSLDPSMRFDVIFLDGLHEFRQTYRDVVNASRHLADGGLIIVDDVVPQDRYAAIPSQTEALAQRRKAGISGAQWQGDVYKVLSVLHNCHPEVWFRTVGMSGATQALLRLPRGYAGIEAVDDARLEAIDAWGYDEAFAKGIPDFFQPTSETEAIEWACRPDAG